MSVLVTRKSLQTLFQQRVITVSSSLKNERPRVSQRQLCVSKSPLSNAHKPEGWDWWVAWMIGLCGVFPGGRFGVQTSCWCLPNLPHLRASSLLVKVPRFKGLVSRHGCGKESARLTIGNRCEMVQKDHQRVSFLRRVLFSSTPPKLTHSPHTFPKIGIKGSRRRAARNEDNNSA